MGGLHPHAVEDPLTQETPPWRPGLTGGGKLGGWDGEMFNMRNECHHDSGSSLERWVREFTTAVSAKPTYADAATGQLLISELAWYMHGLRIVPLSEYELEQRLTEIYVPGVGNVGEGADDDY